MGYSISRRSRGQLLLLFTTVSTFFAANAIAMPSDEFVVSQRTTATDQGADQQLPLNFTDEGKDYSEVAEWRQAAVAPTAATMTGDPTSWAKLEISPATLGSVKYGNIRIHVYPHAKNDQATNSDKPKRYFYAPLSLLNHKSAVSSVNKNVKQSQKYQVSFQLDMWNDDLQNAVVDWIRRTIDSKVNEELVQITPFEQLTLGCATCFNERYTLSTAWTPYTMDKSITMQLFCYSEVECGDLAQEMRTSPEKFSDLRLLLSVASQTSQTKTTQISVESVRNSNMVNAFRQTIGAKDSILLTGEDEQRFFSDTANSIILNTFDDSNGVFSDGSKTEILNFLKANLLDPGRIIIKEIGDKNWESVYWNPDNYRPDHTTKAFNDVYSKSDKETQTKMIDEWTNTNKVGVGFGLGFKGFEIKTQVDVDLSRAGKKSKEDVEKFMQEAKNTVQWDGSKFVPKPMELSKFNMAKLRDTQTFKDNSVKVSYRTALLTVNIHTPITAKLEPTDAFMELQLQLNTMGKAVPGSVPTGCVDIKALGWTKSGFYTAKSIKTNKIITVYCDFTKQSGTTGYETLIGYNDVKTSTGVSFLVQRTSNYASAATTLPFQVAQLNIGGAMDINTGLFTAPVNGLYHFSFTARSAQGDSGVHLFANGVKIGGAYVASVDQSMPMVATVNLKKGEKVHVAFAKGSIFDNVGDPRTVFAGFLIEENLVL